MAGLAEFVPTAVLVFSSDLQFWSSPPFWPSPQGTLRMITTDDRKRVAQVCQICRGTEPQPSWRRVALPGWLNVQELFWRWLGLARLPRLKVSGGSGSVGRHRDGMPQKGTAVTSRAWQAVMICAPPLGGVGNRFSGTPRE
jgi:hypothetical protein